MLDKMKQLMEMKKRADKIKQELDSMIIDVNEVEGINIKINGTQIFDSININEGYLSSQEKDKFEQDLLRCINAAIAKSQQLATEKMKSALPGFPGM